jgi:hypothetical protein
MTTHWFFTFIIYLFFWIFLFPGIFLVFFSLFSLCRENWYESSKWNFGLIFALGLLLVHTFFTGVITWTIHLGLKSLG